MKNLLKPEIDRYRVRGAHVLRLFGTEGDSGCGAFFVPRKDGAPLKVIVSDGMGWDHVSVSLPTRCPTWSEMERIKRIFFHDDETAMQLHIPPSDHISNHDFCLHLWRPNNGDEIPRPPSLMVGIPGLNVATMTEAEAAAVLLNAERQITEIR